MKIEKYFQEVMHLAKKAYAKKEVPIGAIIVDRKGKILGRGYNLAEGKSSVLEHAELRALKQAFKRVGDWRLDGAALYVNLEPCMMCLGAIWLARVKKVIYCLKNKEFGSWASRLTANQRKKLFPRLQVEKTDICEQESRRLLKKFFKKLRKQ